MICSDRRITTASWASQRDSRFTIVILVAVVVVPSASLLSRVSVEAVLLKNLFWYGIRLGITIFVYALLPRSNTLDFARSACRYRVNATLGILAKKTWSQRQGFAKKNNLKSGIFYLLAKTRLVRTSVSTCGTYFRFDSFLKTQILT